MQTQMGPYPADLAALQNIRFDLGGNLANGESCRKTIDELLLVVTEIATNSIRHADPPPQSINLELCCSPSEIAVTVIDDGGEAAGLPQRLTAAAEMDAVILGEGGMGIGLIASLCPDHDYQFVDGRNRLTIRRPIERSFKKRVTVIDDDRVMARLLASYLEPDFQVRLFHDAAEALASVTQDPPNLIISDIDMPEMDGITLRRKLQEGSESAMVPFVFLTGLDAQDIEEQANSLGIDEFLDKPVSKRRIHTVVNRIMRRSQQMRETLAPQLDAAITNSLRPPMPSTLNGFEIEAAEKASEVGGGDIVISRQHEGYSDLFLIDVMGHGLQAKLFAHLYAGFINGLLRSAPSNTSLTEILKWLSEALQSEPGLNKSLLTCLLLRFKDKGSIEIANAGHPKPMVIEADGKVREVEIEGPLLGLGIDDYPTIEIRLTGAQRLLAFTDGLLDGLGIMPNELCSTIGRRWVESGGKKGFAKVLLDGVEATVSAGHGHADDTTIISIGHALAEESWMMNDVKEQVTANFELPDILDCEWAHEEKESLLKQVAELGEQELDLRFDHVEFVDSAGIGVIVALHRHCVALSKNLRIHAISGQPLALVRQVGLDRVVEVHPVGAG